MIHKSYLTHYIQFWYLITNSKKVNEEEICRIACYSNGSSKFHSTPFYETKRSMTLKLGMQHRFHCHSAKSEQENKQTTELYIINSGFEVDKMAMFEKRCVKLNKQRNWRTKNGRSATGNRTTDLLHSGYYYYICNYTRTCRETPTWFQSWTFHSDVYTSYIVPFTKVKGNLINFVKILNVYTLNSVNSSLT